MEQLLMRAARSRMGPELRRDVLAFVDLAWHAGIIGPTAVPGWLVPIFDFCGRKARLPGALLAATAAVLTGCDPGYYSSTQPMRAGLLSLPILETDQANHVIPLSELVDGGGDRAQALTRLRTHICAAADYMLELRGSSGSLAIALIGYTQSEHTAGEIAAAFAFFTLRSIDTTTFDDITEMLK